MIAQVATKNKMEMSVGTRQFSSDGLQKLAKTSIGRPITIGFNSTSVGKIIDAWLEGGSLFVEFESELFDMNYLVPSIRVASSKAGIFKKVVCDGFGLTNNPVDKSLLSIKDTNEFIIKEERQFFFLNDDKNKNGPYNSYTDANKAMLEYSNLL